MPSSSADLPQLAREFDGVELCDKRLDRRLIKIVDDVARDPGTSYPTLYEDDAAALEALYRFCNNPRLKYEQIVSGHARSTLQRAREARVVVAAHDTSEFSYGDETARTGLGHLHDGGNGFFGHFALLLTADGPHRPLGVVASSLWARPEVPEHLRGSKNREKRRSAKAPDKRESQRWKNLVIEVEKLAGDEVEVIHVCDREADDYVFFAVLIDAPARFVVRARCNRRVDADPPLKLRDKLKLLPSMVSMEVPLVQRKHPRDSPLHAKQVHPERKARTANLQVSAGPVDIVRPDDALKTLSATLRLNVVWVHEVDCPLGEEPIDWVLYTTEPIDTAEQVVAVIKHYRGRWRIEEYFKALKSGCSIEKRQLCSFKSLSIALAVALPIAWRLLLLRSIAREKPEAPATAVLTPVQIEVLNLSLRKAKNRLGSQATARQAMLSVAAFGGHLKHNGEPGWQTIGRGYEKLLEREIAYRQGWEACAARAEAPGIESARGRRGKGAGDV